MALRVSTLFFLCFSLTALAEYVEGIDTTDENGWGLDSAFHLHNRITGPKLVCYTNQRSPSRDIFKYSFEEIQLAADSLSLSSVIVSGLGFYFQQNNYCFVVCRDSSFYKFKVTDYFSDSESNTRYIYKYGTNTTPLNRTMMPSNYDRSVRYKPNNLAYLSDNGNTDRFSWEPPLSNDNQLQGYIIYIQKNDVTIDTSAQINLAQWDSVGFTDTTTFAMRPYYEGSYYNIVAVYTEGRSDFLKGWSRVYRTLSVFNRLSTGRDTKALSVHTTQRGAFIMSNHGVAPSLLAIVDFTGRRIAYFSNHTGNHIFWNTSQQGIPPGLYLLRAEFPDKSAMTRPFTVTR